MSPALSPAVWPSACMDADAGAGSLQPGGSGTSSSVRELVRLVGDGDEGAARGLVEQLHPLVTKIVRAHLPRRAAEEDLVQEVFVKMFHRLGQYEGRVPFEHWVSRIAVNHCRNAIRSQVARPEWRLSDLTDDPAGLLGRLADSGATQGPAMGGESMALSELVEELLSILEPRDRALIRWLEMDDLTIEEIRARTGWSSTLIRVRAFRARQKLNARYRRMRKEEAL